VISLEVEEEEEEEEEREEQESCDRTAHQSVDDGANYSFGVD